VTLSVVDGQAAGLCEYTLSGYVSLEQQGTFEAAPVTVALTD